MLFLSTSTLFSISGFISLIYLVILTSIIIYLIPIFGENHFTSTSSYASKVNFFLLKGATLTPIFYVLSFLLFLLLSFASFSEISVWMGHILVNSFSKKIFFILFFMFILYLNVFFTSAVFSSREIYDFLIVNVNSIVWLYFLFLSNSVLSAFFIIEVLSALLFLLLVSSAFSSLSFYNNLDLNSHHFLSNTLPITFLKSIIFFFWVSLVASLNLFMFTLLMYTSLFSFDWFLLEHVFFYATSVSTSDFIFLFGLIWYVLIFSIFTKCGLAPFFFWKPTFFKGLTFNSIFFYISIFYFSIFLFFINFMSTSFFFIFNYYFNLFIVIVIIGLFLVLLLLLEAFYIKTFLAISSILNSLIIFLAMSGSHIEYINVLV